jgi:hypothetical protein
MSHSFKPSPLLRLALIGDAIASGVTGLLLAGGTGLLTWPLGLPEQLMRYAGLFLLPYAAVVAYVGTRAMVSKPAVWAIIAANVIWVVKSFLLLASGWISPTGLGVLFVAAQALVVSAFVGAQFTGLRRTFATTLAEA